MVGFDAQNKNILDQRFLCSACSLILHDPVKLNACGHRLCQSCCHTQNQDVIKCVECHIETPTNQIMVDRGFHNDMQSLPITCSHCNWTNTLKNYQAHLDQAHPNPQCYYCHQHFTSINRLNQHQVFQCQSVTTDCILKDFGCHQQILRSELSNHYLSEQHQNAIVHVIDQMKSQLNDSQTTATTDIQYALNQVDELYESIRILRSGAESFSSDVKRLNDELHEHRTKLQSVIEKSSQVQVSVEEENDVTDRDMRNMQTLYSELILLKDKMDEMQYVSYDGTFTWKITNLQEKMRDAQAERQISIYSPPFYSSPTGYKIRTRLYLNGDGNARRTHMSLFFVLMRGRNDSILKFPFNYKVTFCLYDQTSAQRHIIDSFRPDIRLSSFQRPQSEMNRGNGILKFVPLAMVQQENSPYIQDDTMFIKVMVNFGKMPKVLLPYALSLNPGLPTNVQHDMIREEIERRAQTQTSQQEQKMN